MGQKEQANQGLAKQLRAARIAKGMSLRAVGEAAGVSGAMVQLWEKGRIGVKDAYVPALSKALDIPLGLRVSDDGRDRFAVLARPTPNAIVLGGVIKGNGAVTSLNRQAVESFTHLIGFRVKTRQLESFGLSEGDVALFRRQSLTSRIAGQGVIVPKEGEPRFGYLDALMGAYFEFEDEPWVSVTNRRTKAIAYMIGEITCFLRQAGVLYQWAVPDLGELLQQLPKAR